MLPILDRLLRESGASHEVIVDMIKPLIYALGVVDNRNHGSAESTPE